MVIDMFVAQPSWGPFTGSGLILLPRSVQVPYCDKGKNSRGPIFKSEEVTSGRCPQPTSCRTDEIPNIFSSASVAEGQKGIVGDIGGGGRKVEAISSCFLLCSVFRSITPCWPLNL